MKVAFVVLVCVVAVARAGLLGGTYTALTVPSLAHGAPLLAAAPYGSVAHAAPYGYGAHAAPYGSVAHAAPVAWAPHASVAHHAALAHAPLAVAAHAAPLAVAAHAPIAVAAHAAPLAVAAHAPVVHGAAYKAVTRGAVHTAPLPGHIVGSAHVNVAPAPGTW